MFEQLIVRIILITFFFTSIGPFPDVSAQTIIDLPVPGIMVNKSGFFQPLQLKGILVNIKNPLRFDFLVDKGDSHLYAQPLKDGIIRLAKYFLTCLTVPEDDLWVNLSPYERDRIVPGNFGITLMGKDLLEQDYLLKQIMASLSYPENDLGKRFWQKVYRKSYELYGTTEIPINTFNKVWIIPKSAQVYVQGNAAFVVNSQLDVMLEADYLSMSKHQGLPLKATQGNHLTQSVLKEIILPELRQEVNEGKNFAVVRQVYNAMILATWYKRHLKDSVLGRIYVGRNEVNGVDIADKNTKEKIFQRYLRAYKKCVYNYIKEDYDPATRQTVPRKYASGGMYFAGFGGPGDPVYNEVSNTDGMRIGTDLAMATIDMTAIDKNGVSIPDFRNVINTNPFHQVPFEVYNQAMLAGLRKFFNNWKMGLAFAIAVGVMLPTVAQGETWTSGKNGVPIMQVEDGDQLGYAMEKIRINYKKSNPEEYKRSAYAGPLYAALNRVTNVKHKNSLTPAQQIQFTQPVPQNVLEALSGPVAQAVQSDRVVPAPVVLTDQPAPPPAIATGPPAPTISAVPPAPESIAIAPLTTAQPVVVSAGSPPPEAEEFLSMMKMNLVFVVLFGLAGLNARGYVFSGLPRKAKITAVKKGPALPQSSGTSPPVPSLPISESALLDVTLPPPAASPGEAQILADDLTKLRAVANGEIAPPPAIFAEEDPQRAKSNRQDLRWMDAGALLGALGLGWWLDGGISSVLLAYPFITRVLYVAQKWLHEWIHPLSANFLYPAKIRTAWSGGNWKGNLSLRAWGKSLIPLTRANPSYVDLPFVKAEGNGWDKLRNKLVGWTGFWGSAALAASAGYFIIGLSPLLIPLTLSALAVLKGSYDSGDLGGSQDADEGKFGCGIIGFVKRTSSQGISRKQMRSWLDWFFTGMESSTARGGQQAGLSTNLFGDNGNFMQLDEKITKQKRNWLFWQTWDQGPVFFRNMVNDLHTRFYKALPKKLVPIDNFAKISVLKVLGHVRFATNGLMVGKAAHPHASAEEIREQWTYDAVQKTFRKIIRVFRMTSAFNGDHDYTRIGLPDRPLLFGAKLGNSQMRRFFSAAGHSYYGGKVTKRYLKVTVSDGRIHEQRVKTDYNAVLAALYKKGYVSYSGFVNRRFKGLDEEFKSWFPDYKTEVFDEIESALFGIPPGDAPVIPLEQHLFLTQGNWFASLRYAHIMANHRDLKEAMDDILFEKEGRAMGQVFSGVFDQVEPFIIRRGHDPQDPETVRTLNDLYVKDEESAKKLGLESQYQMIKIFKDMLNQRMRQEARRQTLAGEVFRQWEQKWKEQGEDAGFMRQRIIDVAVEKFFTADNVAATKEFVERSEGTWGVFMDNSLDDSITLYQDNQDVVIGINQAAGVFGFASDPRALKSIGPNQEKVEEILHLRDGEVANVSYSPTGKVEVRTWMRLNGTWTESTKEELAERIYPTAEYVNGVKNEYYIPPPVEYAHPHRIVQEDFKNIPKILARAQAEWDDPGSYNSQSTDYLGQRISETIKKEGQVRLVLIGYDNSRILSEHFKEISQDLIAQSKLSIDVIDANKFYKSPSKYDIKPDDIVMIVSKSGATFSTKLALRIIKKLVYQENIFCVSARIDSVLNTMIGQGLRPGTDKFTKRIFVTGEFYPAETPVASEVLLMFQLQQLAVNLVRALEAKNDPQNSLGLKLSANRLERRAQRITEASITEAQEYTGFDINGNTYAQADTGKKAIGNYLGKVALETFKIKLFIKFFVYIALIVPIAVLPGSYMVGGMPGLLIGALFDVFWITEIVPYLATKLYRKMIGRPANGRLAPFDLFIAAPPVIASTQRNFISRIMTNRLKSIGPAAIYGENPMEDFTATHASDQKRGDINLRFSLQHRTIEGRMGVGQATYPQTAIFGTDFIRGRPEMIEVVVQVPHEEDDTPNEINLMDNTVGMLGLMIASKAIGVEMARVASWDGRLFNLAYTFSSAGVHTTQINPISQEAVKIMEGPDKRQVQLNFAADSAMRSLDNHNNPGGIDMNSRLMKLKITGETENRYRFNDKVQGPIIKGIVPQVSGIVTVTPDMLKAMLGAGYLN